MVRLTPTTSSQTISIVPRVKTATTGLTLKLTRDGTNQSQTITVNAVENNNFMNLDCTFSTAGFLVDNGMYYLELYKGSTLWCRDKAYCTDSYDADQKYTINDGQYNESDSGDSSQQYIFV